MAKKFAGIDFAAVAAKMGGHAAGAAAFTQLNKLKYLKNLPAEKQALKGAIVAAIGYVATPLITKKAGLAGKGNQGTFVDSVGEGIGMIGTMILANAVVKPAAGQPAIFPAISGVDGMEENQIEGILYENEVSGYEQDPVLAGYEQDPVLEGFED